MKDGHSLDKNGILYKMDTFLVRDEVVCEMDSFG
jgi:hypothetical protein